MKKIFISQAMKGLTNEQIEFERNKAIKKIKELYGEVEIIDSFFKINTVQIKPLEKPLWFLGRSIQLLSKADLAVFVGDYQNARGCAIEYKCAKEYGIETLVLQKENEHANLEKD